MTDNELVSDDLPFDPVTQILAELAEDERKAFWDTAVNGEH